MTITEVIKHPLVVAIASLIVGTLIVSFVNRIRSKMARIRYFVTVNRVGITTTDPVFGNIKVAWNNQDLPNLYIATVSLENISNVDIGELDLKVYTEERTHLLSERTSVTGTSYIVPQSDSYQRSLAVQPLGLMWVCRLLDSYAIFSSYVFFCYFIAKSTKCQYFAKI